MKKIAIAFLLAALAVAGAARAFDEIPVYGGSKVGYEDRDLLDGTILEEGVLVVTPEEPWRVFIGDGVTPGGIEIHPKGYVTNFSQVAEATTNLTMHSYSITFGPWAVHGDAGELDIDYEGREHWLRFVRDTGEAYIKYDFDILDANHYRFSLAWSGEGYDFPRLQVSTNLTQGYEDAESEFVTYERPDQSHLVILYEVTYEYEALAFRLFATSRLASGAYFGVPVMAEHGEQVTGCLVVTGRMESVWSEEGEEFRDEYHPGTFTFNGVTWDHLPDLDSFVTQDDISDMQDAIDSAGDSALEAIDALNTHKDDDDNPHGVTLLQAFDADQEEAWDECGIGISGGDGVSALKGFGRLIEMETGTVQGDWHFDERPELGTNGFATTNEVAAAVAAHAGRTDNPHGVTAAQIGALTSESDAAALAALNTASNALRGAVAAHSGRTDNPHGVTASQIGALTAESDAAALAALASHTSASNPHNITAAGIGALTAETDATALAAIVAATNSLAGSVASTYATKAENGAVSNRVTAIEADYVQSADIADFATTGAVASVERRVGALEEAAWSELYTQWTVGVLSPTATNWIPTNLPARSVVVCMALNSTNTIQNLNFGIPGGWEPEEDCMVSFRILRTASGPTWHCYIGDNEVNYVTSGSGRIALVFRWVADAKMWVLWRWSLQYDNAVFNSRGQNKETVGIPVDERFLPVSTP